MTTLFFIAIIFVFYQNERIIFLEKFNISVTLYCILEAVVQRCSVKKVFLEILQNSQENTRARVYMMGNIGR